MSLQSEEEYARALDELARMHRDGQLGDAEYELKRSRLEAEAAKKKSSGGLGCLLGVIALFVVLILGGCFALMSGDDKPASDTQADYTERAKYACRESVKDKLKAPSTAKFQTAAMTSKGFGPTGDYTVTGSVDSQNSFGAQIRSTFTCTMDFVGGQPNMITSSIYG